MGILERKKREKEQRRNAITDAAEKVFFSKGVDIATMDDIAAAAELSKGTLYLYFKSKEDLYLAITKRALEILTDMFEEAVKNNESGIEKVRALGQAYSLFSRKFPDYFYAMIYAVSRIKEIQEDNSIAQACEQQADMAFAVLADSLKKGVGDRSIRSDIDPWKAAIILWGETTGILQLISSKGKRIKERIRQFGFRNVEDVIDYTFAMIRYWLEPIK